MLRRLLLFCLVCPSLLVYGGNRINYSNYDLRFSTKYFGVNDEIGDSDIDFFISDCFLCIYNHYPYQHVLFSKDKQCLVLLPNSNGHVAKPARQVSAEDAICNRDNNYVVHFDHIHSGDGVKGLTTEEKMERSYQMLNLDKVHSKIVQELYSFDYQNVDSMRITPNCVCENPYTEKFDSYKYGATSLAFDRRGGAFVIKLFFTEEGLKHKAKYIREIVNSIK